jgi:hypothetical protein
MGAIALLWVGAFATAASAHYIEVNPPGKAEPKSGWAGGPAPLPGQGKGLILGGPNGDWPMTPAHAGGLNQACHSLRDNGNGVVDIYGPPAHGVLPEGFTSGCAHGEVIPPG